MFANDKKLQHKLFYSHNFGHNGPLDFHGLGINAKISELQGAMGLAVFKYIDHIIEERKNVVEQYDQLLDFSKIKKMKLRENTLWNYSYYPVIFESEAELLKIVEALKEQDIFPRRYFYPSLNTVPFVDASEMPVSEDIASRILCLPLYVGLISEKIQLISEIINKN